MGTETVELDMDGRYRVDGWPGIAFWIDGYATREVEVPLADCDTCKGWGWTALDADGAEVTCGDCDGLAGLCDLETVEDRDWVQVVMVGDNRRHLVETRDLTPITEDEYCPGCGQLGRPCWGHETW